MSLSLSSSIKALSSSLGLLAYSNSSSTITSFCGVSIDVNSSQLRLIKFCRWFDIADFPSDIKNLTTWCISSPPDGIGAGLYCREKTFASILIVFKKEFCKLCKSLLRYVQQQQEQVYLFF